MQLVTLLSTILFLGSSCAVFFPRQDDSLIIVDIHGTVHKPYCGGAKPSPDVAAGYYEPMSGQSFKVFQGAEYSLDLAVVREFTFDQEGNTKLKLAPGNYVVMHADKLLPLDEFMAKYGAAPNEHYKIKDAGCFNEWKNTVDLYIQVSNDTLIEYRQKAKCWVGTNPCMEYVGPPAP
jgi:hypothetical protein